MIRFEVVGTPVQQGSKSGFYNKHLNRVVMTDQNAKTLKPWRAMVVAAALDALASPDCSSYPKPTKVDVVIEFRLPRPKSQTKAERAEWAHGKMPDVDKLVRSVLDSLTDARAFDDDAQVAQLVVSKTYVGDEELAGATVMIGPTVTNLARFFLNRMTERTPTNA